jgi:hypothetical protein
MLIDRHRLSATERSFIFIHAAHQEPTLQHQVPASASTVSAPLPAAEVEELVEAGIAADDSEQRSLAILELAKAPVEQSLGGLGRILRENRDRRSRLTALEALMHLPDTEPVRAERQRLLEMLSGDPDTYISEAVRAATAASG